MYSNIMSVTIKTLLTPKYNVTEVGRVHRFNVL